MPSTASTRWRWPRWSSALAGLALAGCAAPSSAAPAPSISGPVEAPALSSAAYDVSLLDDPVVPLAARARALLRLEAAGVAAFEPAIARMVRPPDPIVLTEAPAPTVLFPRAPAGGPVRLAAALEGTLYRILDAGPPKPPDALQGEDPVRYVVDWRAWWKAHRGDSLATLRAWAAEARARGGSTLAGLAPGGLSRGPAPRAPGTTRLPDPEAPEVRAFLALEAAVAAGADCERVQKIAGPHPALARHAAHACGRGLSPTPGAAAPPR